MAKLLEKAVYTGAHTSLYSLVWLPTSFNQNYSLTRPLARPSLGPPLSRLPSPADPLLPCSARSLLMLAVFSSLSTVSWVISFALHATNPGPDSPPHWSHPPLPCDLTSPPLPEPGVQWTTYVGRPKQNSFVQTLPANPGVSPLRLGTPFESPTLSTVPGTQ